MAYSLGVGMYRIDQNIALHPRRHRWHDQYRAPLLREPFLPECLAQPFILPVPSWMAGCLEYFIADAFVDGDADMMLLGGSTLPTWTSFSSIAVE